MHRILHMAVSEIAFVDEPIAVKFLLAGYRSELA
jgi:hypothetical protein